jgi:type 2 lantibiotic biosynthesis protein LanM
MTTTLTHKKSQLLDTIALRASFPLERLQPEMMDSLQNDEQRRQESLQHLYSVVQAIDEEQQARFLAHLNLDELQLIRALSLPASADQVTNSSWITLLVRILTEYAYDPMMSDQTFYSNNPLPFEELFLPFIRYARQEIQSLVPDYASLLSLGAQIQLEHWLLTQLSTLAGEPLVLEFMQFLALHDEVSTLDEQQRVLYDQFLSQYGGEGFLDFFAEYSLLARLLVHCVEQWIEVCGEFLERVKADSDLISHIFFADQPSGPITGIRAGCSDAHHHGRTVFLLLFANEHKLVYKPRCMEIDEAFFRCIEWLNTKGLSLDLKCARILNRGAYGWMEYIEHVPCTTSTEVHAYYRRCGLLLCLFYVLGSTDIHYENLIAHGAYPIPIDLETILCPLFRDFFSTALAEEQKKGYCVQRSLMLPTKMKVHNQEVDLSVLGDGNVSTHHSPSLTWQYINTDAMTLSYKQLSANARNSHKASIDGTTAKSSDYVEELVTGFRDMYHFLTEHRAEILEDGAMLNIFADCPIRIVYRPTFVYVKHLQRLSSFDLLQDGTRCWLDSQIFKRRLLKEQTDDRLWSLVSGEMAAIERRDVPYFGGNTNGTYMYDDEGIITEDIFENTPLEQIRSCIAGLCDEDQEQQIQIIYEAYAATEE